jgi:hypothetical protein
MIDVRRLTQVGIESFRFWLEAGEGSEPPAHLVDGSEHTEIAYSVNVNPEEVFASRYDYGKYLHERMGSIEFKELMARQNDGLWAWFACLYFSQLSAKARARSEHYLVVRKGPTGSLAYRQAARTSFELVHIHGANSLVCLSVGMDTFGDMAEQLASRQTLAHNRGFFKAAFELYVRDGKLRRGASTKPKKPKNRRPGDRTGLGGARRLATALTRLDLTFDTEVMDSDGIVAVLPREFVKWTSSSV